MQSEEETPKQLSKDKAHRSGLENGEPKIFDQKETEYLWPLYEKSLKVCQWNPVRHMQAKKSNEGSLL